MALAWRCVSRQVGPMPSRTYALFEQAMRERRQIVCVYEGLRRELCPVILGHSKSEEKALTFQFGGQGSKGALPPGGAWRCLFLFKVSDVELRDGPWMSGSDHSERSTCVEDVDLDINPASPYAPQRKL